MSGVPKQVVVAGSFDDLRSRQIRFLEEAAKLGNLTVLLWSDELIRRFEGKPPKFPESERLYVLKAIRYVQRVQLVTEQSNKAALPEAFGFKPDLWAIYESQRDAATESFPKARGVPCHVVRDEDLRGFPIPQEPAAPSSHKKVIVTGCFDWFHSGHVRFFEEVSAFGDIYVVVGHDANIRLLKGEGHPLIPQDERRYMVGSVRFVTQALVSTGSGWLDAEPEIRRIKPNIYAVNEDGDRGGKREYCGRNGIRYLVLKRTPAPGLPPRTSTDLRGY